MNHLNNNLKNNEKNNVEKIKILNEEIVEFNEK